MRMQHRMDVDWKLNQLHSAIKLMKMLTVVLLWKAFFALFWLVFWLIMVEIAVDIEYTDHDTIIITDMMLFDVFVGFTCLFFADHWSIDHFEKCICCRCMSKIFFVSRYVSHLQALINTMRETNKKRPAAVLLKSASRGTSPRSATGQSGTHDHDTCTSTGSAMSGKSGTNTTGHSTLNPSIATTISIATDIISPRYHSGGTSIVILRKEYEKYVQEYESMRNITFKPSSSRSSMNNKQFDHDNLNSQTKHMIGSWCIEDEKQSLIGKGEFSKVYKAIDYNFIHKNKVNSVFVAIKIIDNSDKSEKNLIEAQWVTQNEIHCLKTVSHHNIIKMIAYDLKATFNGKDVIAFVLEYAPNGNLRQLVTKFRGLPDVIARTYFHQIISAIDTCHSAGIVHRDLKLNNIVLDFYYNLKICDFGLAKVTLCVDFH